MLVLVVVLVLVLVLVLCTCACTCTCACACACACDSGDPNASLAIPNLYYPYVHLTTSKVGNGIEPSPRAAKKRQDIKTGKSSIMLLLISDDGPEGDLGLKKWEVRLRMC